MTAIRTDENLFRNILETIKESVRKNEYLVYGILLYTLENINIVQALDNKRQWIGIDTATGNNTLLCYVDLSEYIETRYSERHMTAEKMQGLLGFPMNDNQAYCSNLEECMTALGYDEYNKIEYPFILFFQLDPKGIIQRTCTLKLKNRDANYIIARFQKLNERLAKLDRSKYDSETLFNLIKDGITPDIWTVIAEKKFSLFDILKLLFTIINTGK
ncbi:MAG: hypothetical protein LBL58_03090 [Tannerellaceae bacterium]|jgi:hypothetical protein|nr:hypothetical protein [Tannerellaceae bacterium]